MDLLPTGVLVNRTNLVEPDIALSDVLVVHSEHIFVLHTEQHQSAR